MRHDGMNFTRNDNIGFSFGENDKILFFYKRTNEIIEIEGQSKTNMVYAKDGRTLLALDGLVWTSPKAKRTSYVETVPAVVTVTATEVEEYTYGGDGHETEDGEELTEYPADLPITTESSYEEAEEARALADGDGDWRNGEDEDITHDNTRRAGFALEALLAYWKLTGPGNELGTALNDMLNDMLHLRDALGGDEDTMSFSSIHYDAELTGSL